MTAVTTRALVCGRDIDESKRRGSNAALFFEIKRKLRVFLCRDYRREQIERANS